LSKAPDFFDILCHISDIDSSNPVISKAGFDISRDYAVWIAEGEKVITLYDLDEHKESQIGDKQSAKTNLRVDGKYVAWIDSRHGGSDVYLYDIGTKKERRLTDGTTEAAELELSGNYVAWSGKHGGKSDIYLYTMTTTTAVNSRAITGSTISPRCWRTTRSSILLATTTLKTCILSSLPARRTKCRSISWML
jgi:beta propeller repeat protein